MTTILIPSATLRETKRLFGKLRHRRMTLPVLTHILLSAGRDGVRLTATNLDHWIEIRVSGEDHEPVSFLIPPDAMEAACRADRGSLVAFTAFGGKRSKDLGMVIRQGGIDATSLHPTLDAKEFPVTPDLKGEETTLPPGALQSLAAVAGCVSTDATRHILNGVLFTPGDGGQLVATDGKLLAVSPADVPPQSFVLPHLAASVLEQPAFSTGLVTFIWLDAKDPEFRRVAFRCGNHLLVATTLAGNYPNYRQVIPSFAKAHVVIPHDRRPGLIAWLRSLKSQNHRDPSVRLDFHERGQLTLTHRDDDGRSATLQIPVEIHGAPPVIAFNPVYLARALECVGRDEGAGQSRSASHMARERREQIGSTLCLSDELSPGLCRHPNGRFCVIMPMRVAIPAPASIPEAAPPNTAQAA